MRPFKFLNYAIVKAHDGGDIFAGDIFYTVNKEDIVTPRKTTPKYTIVQRTIHESDKKKFKPDHNLLWYFRSKSNAEYLVDIWKRQDKIS